MPFWRSSRSFFAVRKNFRFLRVFLVWALPGAVQEVVGRETLQNKGFRSNFALWGLVDLRWTRCIALMLQYIFDTNFSGSHKFVFSEVRIFDQFGFGRQKTAWGCRTEEIFKMTFFPFCPGGAQFVKFLARFRFCSSVAVWVRFGPLPEICLRLRCGWFFRVFRCSFFDTVFANLKRDLLKIPSLLFVFCSFLRFLLELGSTQPCTCVLGQLALNLSFLFVFLFVCLQKHCFPLKKGYFCSFLSVSLSFSLVSFTSPFHSLSLSFSCLFFLSFLVLLFLFVTFLVFLLFFLALFLCFRPMTTTTTTSKY